MRALQVLVVVALVGACSANIFWPVHDTSKTCPINTHKADGRAAEAAVRKAYEKAMCQPIPTERLDQWVHDVVVGEKSIRDVQEEIEDGSYFACELDLDCANGGKCVGDACKCADGYRGPSCNCTVGCPNDCSGHGVCLAAECMCEEGWEGADCASARAPPSCPNDCSGHGKCHEDGKCSCEHGFAGEDCSERSCPHDCNRRGECHDGVCACEHGWVGDACEKEWVPPTPGVEPECVSRADCGGKGNCTDGVCHCWEGYGGERCSEVVCIDRCNERGACIEGACVCDLGWEGTNCSARVRSAFGAQMGEVGTVVVSSQRNTTVHFRKRFRTPVVFAQPPTFHGPFPAIARVLELTPVSMTLQLVVPPNFADADAEAVDEHVDFLVVEAGTYELANGLMLEANVTRVEGRVGAQVLEPDFAAIVFNNTWAAAPVVFSQVVSRDARNPLFLHTRQNEATPGQVGVALAGATNAPALMGERVGYVAMAANHSVWSGLEYEVGATSANVSRTRTAYRFARCFNRTDTGRPKLMGLLSSTVQVWDNQHLRVHDDALTACGFEALAEGDQASNPLSHDRANYMAFSGRGLLTARRVVIAAVAPADPRAVHTTASAEDKLLGTSEGGDVEVEVGAKPHNTVADETVDVADVVLSAEEKHKLFGGGDQALPTNATATRPPLAKEAEPAEPAVAEAPVEEEPVLDELTSEERMRVTEQREADALDDAEETQPNPDEAEKAEVAHQQALDLERQAELLHEQEKKLEEEQASVSAQMEQLQDEQQDEEQAEEQVEERMAPAADAAAREDAPAGALMP